MNILIGADPEVFVRKPGLKTFSSAYGLIPGTKEKPYPMGNGAVQVDGMALEFNIAPSKSEEEFVGNIQEMMGILADMVPDYEVVAVPTAKFMPKVFAESPEEALELGCEPDFNAYTQQENPRPDASKADYRTGAGHVHIGWTEGMDVNDAEHIEACEMLAKQMDFYLGLGSILYDTDNKRRTLYGKAGCFRPKPYGIEYRTLSNAWLNDPKLMSWVYRTAKQACEDLMEGKSAYNELKNFAQGIIDRENNGDNTKKIIRRFFGLFGIDDPTK